MSAVAAPVARARARKVEGRRRGAELLGYAGLAVVAYVPVILSSRGKVAADTKQYLYLDPGRLISRAVSMWDPHVGMGTVTHQTIGYLFPMGPYYWVLDKLGSPDWFAQRLWLGSLLVGAALGVLYLFRTFGVRGPGVVVAALAYMLSPYVLDYSARISVLLMPWAALPWLIGVVRKGLRDGGWRYPAIFALVVQLVGGVNATALLFAIIGPALWIAYAWLIAREVDGRRALSVSLRTAGLTIVTSLWWIAGLRMQGAYGLDVLKFTETVEAVARTSTPNEVLRGLGYWFFYGQDRLGPWIEASSDYTQHGVVILAGYVLAALSLLFAGLVRWRHRVFFIILTLVGVVIAVGAYPYGHPSPIGALFKAFATGSTAGLALRSTARAVPLIALGLAMLLGIGLNALWQRLRAGGRPLLATASIAAAVVLIVVNFPALWNGNYYGKNLQRPEHIPSYWLQAAHYLDGGSHQTRVLELPGSDFASYRWGNTVDPITPGLMDRPYVARELIPYGTAASADLLNALDRRVQEGITDPRGVAPLLRRMSVGDAVLRNDIQYERYALVPPREVDRLFAGVPGLGASTSFGTPTAPALAKPHQDEISLEDPANERPSAPVVVYPVSDSTAIVRAESASHALMVSGDGEGLVDVADVGLLDGAGAVQYSASYRSDRALRAAIRPDTVLVVTDQNRLRARRWTSVRDNVGATDGPGLAPLQQDTGDARLDLFPGERPTALTITEQRGVRSVTATSYGNRITLTPEDRPSQALDGDTYTAWRAAAYGDAVGERIRIELDGPITTDHVNLVQPLNRGTARFITGVTLTFDGHAAVHAALGPSSRVAGGQTVAFPRRRFRTLEIRIDRVNPPGLFGATDAVGFAEIRMRDEHARHDVRVDEVVRMPRDLLDATRSDQASHPLVLVMSRDRLRPAPPRIDPEAAIVREFSLPAARSFTLTGSASVSPYAPAAAIDRVLGMRDATHGGVTTDASAFLSGCTECRSASAIDGAPGTAWQTPFGQVRGQWAQFRVARPISFDHMDVRVIADDRHSVPTRLRLQVDGATRVLTLPAIPDQPGENASTVVRLTFPPVKGASLRLTIDDVRDEVSDNFGSGGTTLEPAAIAELGIPGLALASAPAHVETSCRADLLTIDGHPVPVRVTGAARDASASAGLGVTPCGVAKGAATRSIRLGPGQHIVATADGRRTGVAFDRLVFASGASGTAFPASNGQVTALGPTVPRSPAVRLLSNGATKMRVRVSGATSGTPFWLVLGESHSAGWKAHVVGGRSLGMPRLVDGYANGWMVTPSTSTFDVTLEWTPQRTVWASLALSVAAVLACIAIVAATWWRRRDVLTVMTAPPASDADVALGWPRGARARVGRRARWIAPVLVGLLVALVAGLPIGLLAAAAVGVVAFQPSWRVILVVLPAALLLACGAYIAIQQHRYHFPPVFEWPTLFPHAAPLAWIALALLFGDAVLEVFSRRREYSSSTTVDP